MTTQITQNQIALYHPQTVGDFPESGGHVTSAKVDPLKPDEIFGDLTDWAVVDGEVGIRSVYFGVDSDNAAVYSHGHAFIAKGSDNPDVHLTLFSTGRHGDTRADLQNYLEGAGMIQGNELRWVLRGNHIQGQSTIRAVSLANARGPGLPVADPRPEVNDIILLSVEGQGLTPHRQYFRVVKILSDQVVMESDSIGDFYKSQILIQLSQRLDADYPGMDQPARYTNFARPTLIRSTQYADALEAKSIKRLQADLAADATALKVDGLFSTLVPNSATSDPLVDQALLPGNLSLIACGAAGSMAASATLAADVGPVYSATLHFPNPILPNSLSLAINGVAHQDDGKGNLTGPAGTLFSGTADYAGRKVILAKDAAWTAGVSATATPAAPVDGTSFTAAIDVAANNLSADWVENLDPPPAPGTVVAEYKASQVWYRLADDANGHLRGAEGTGAGSVDYVAGDATLSTAAYADIGSKILWTWGTRQVAADRSGGTATLHPVIRIDLAHPPRPGTYSVTWHSGGALKTATADAYGAITGDATGRILTSAQKVWLQTALLPDANSEFVSAYDYRTVALETFHPVIRPGGAAGQMLAGMNGSLLQPGVNELEGLHARFVNWNTSGSVVWGVFVYGSVEMDLASADDATTMLATITTADAMMPGTVHVEYALGHVGVTLGSAGDATNPVKLVDDGAGKLLVAEGPGVSVGLVLASSSINYAGKSITVPLVLPPRGSRSAWTLVKIGNGFIPLFLTAQNPFIWREGTAVAVSYQVDTGTPTTVTNETAPVPPLAVELLGVSDPVVPGSVGFTLGGSRYADRAGTLVRDINPATGAGTAAGEVDYVAGKAVVTAWPAGASATLAVAALATVNGGVGMADMAGRIAASPLAAGQFIVRATGVDGTAARLTTNVNGVVSGDWGEGAIDWASGIFALRFGRWLGAASGLWQGSPVAYADAEPSAADAAIRWRPLLVIPSTAKYDAVAQTYLPISSARLGVQAERLPKGGQVQTFRVGDLCVVHRTHTVALPNPLAADTVVDLGETLVTWARVLDANGLELPTTEYSATPEQLDLGHIVTAPSLNLAGFTYPLSCEYGIEDLVKLTDANISGDLRFHPAVRHAYPATYSYLSGALFMGDRQARITTAFELANFSQGWTDTPYGTTPLAQYDRVGFPVTVKNYPAPTERFVLIFTNTTAFDCYGEISGLVGSGNTTTDFYIRDRATGAWYVKLSYQGWGGGWGTGKAYRINYESSAYPLDLVRAAVSGAGNNATDNFRIGLRGYSNKV